MFHLLLYNGRLIFDLTITEGNKPKRAEPLLTLPFLGGERFTHSLDLDCQYQNDPRIWCLVCWAWLRSDRVVGENPEERYLGYDL
jgi:hypothetical protein